MASPASSISTEPYGSDRAKNPFGLEDVDGLAAVFVSKRSGSQPTNRGGMFELAVNSPDDTLTRVGWPTQLRPEIPVEPEATSGRARSTDARRQRHLRRQ